LARNRFFYLKILELPIKVLFRFFQHVGIVFDNSGHVRRGCFGQRNWGSGWAFARTDSLKVDVFCFILVKTSFVKTCKHMRCSRFAIYAMLRTMQLHQRNVLLKVIIPIVCLLLGCAEGSYWNWSNWFERDSSHSDLGRHCKVKLPYQMWRRRWRGSGSISSRWNSILCGSGSGRCYGLSQLSKVRKINCTDEHFNASFQA